MESHRAADAREVIFLHKWHDEVRRTASFTGCKHRNDVGVLEMRRSENFATEAVGCGPGQRGDVR